MATITPVAYNTGSTIDGTLQYGNLAVADTEQDYGAFPGGVRFWATPNQDLGYVIATEVPSGNQPNPLSIPAFVGFYRSADLSEASFVELSNQITEYSQNFTNGDDAKTWLENNGYWTSYGASHTPQLMMLLNSIVGVTSNIWADQSGNSNNGTLYNGYGTSKYNSYQVVTLNGTNAYVNPVGGFGTSLDAYGLTYEVWAYPTKTGNGTLISEWSGPVPPTGWNDAQMGFVSGKINAGVYPNTFNPTGYLQGPNFSANTWYHIVLTYDNIAGSESLYVNGSLIGTTYGTKANPGGTYLTLGRPDIANSYIGNATGYFQGSIGYWSIWDGAITDTQVLNNYNSTKYRFDNSLTLNLDATNSLSYSGAGSTWYDLSGKGHNGTLTNVTYSASSGGTMVFNGTNGVVPISQPIPTGSDFTISAWVYANNVSLSHNIVSSLNSPFWVNNGTLSAGIAGNYTYVNSPSFPTNQWKFVTVTFKDSTNTMKLYINGSLVDTNTNATASYTAENTFIGAHYSGGSNVSFWNGYIPQVYIYLSEQSGTDVSNLFNNTKSTYGL